jgi:hypothetical protein
MSPFTLRPDGEAFETDLMEIIISCQRAYFAGVQQIESGEFMADLDGPSRVLPEKGKIEVLQSLARFPKLCRFLVLHELIHNKLYRKYGSPQNEADKEFRDEVKRLWELGAYEDLM